MDETSSLLAVLGLLFCSGNCATAARQSEAGRTSPPVAPESALTDVQCAESPPSLSISTSVPLSEGDMVKIRSLLRETESSPIVAIGDAKDGRIRVVQWGGYDKCVEFGKNAVFELARADGKWIVVAQYESFVH